MFRSEVFFVNGNDQQEGVCDIGILRVVSKGVGEHVVDARPLQRIALHGGEGGGGAVVLHGADKLNLGGGELGWRWLWHNGQPLPTGWQSIPDCI